MKRTLISMIIILPHLAFAQLSELSKNDILELQGSIDKESMNIKIDDAIEYAEYREDRLNELKSKLTTQSTQSTQLNEQFCKTPIINQIRNVKNRCRNAKRVKRIAKLIANIDENLDQLKNRKKWLKSLDAKALEEKKKSAIAILDQGKKIKQVDLQNHPGFNEYNTGVYTACYKRTGTLCSFSRSRPLDMTDESESYCLCHDGRIGARDFSPDYYNYLAAASSISKEPSNDTKAQASPKEGINGCPGGTLSFDRSTISCPDGSTYKRTSNVMNQIRREVPAPKDGRSSPFSYYGENKSGANDQ